MPLETLPPNFQRRLDLLIFVLFGLPRYHRCSVYSGFHGVILLIIRDRTGGFRPILILFFSLFRQIGITSDNLNTCEMTSTSKTLVDSTAHSREKIIC